MKQHENNSRNKIEHKMVCPNCDRMTKAINTTDFSPAIIDCEGCHYSELTKRQKNKTGLLWGRIRSLGKKGGKSSMPSL